MRHASTVLSDVVSDCIKSLMSTTSQVEPPRTRATSRNLDSAGLLVKMGRELASAFVHSMTTVSPP